jgi:zinc protease
VKRALTCAIAIVLSCGPKPTGRVAHDAPVPWEASRIDWTKPPPLGTPLPFAPPVPQTLSLSNRVRILVVENHRLPLVAVSIVHDQAGSRFDADKHGLAALTLEMLDKGARQRTREDLRDALEVIGARYESHIATDYATMQLVVPSTQLEASLGVVAGMVTAPRFDAAELTRVQRERVAEIEERRQRPRMMAAQVFDRIVFGEHPYAVPADGTTHAVAALTADDVRAFWSRAYRPEVTTVVIAGDVTATDARRLVDGAFGSWAGAATTGATPGSAAPSLGPYSSQLALVDLPGARQSVVLIGKRGPAAGASGQLVDDVANAILGGGVGARLDRELHGKRGLTVGASSSYWRGRWAGSWTAAMTFATDNTLGGIRDALRVIDESRGALSAEDLARAKQNLLAGAQLSFDTTASTARAVERLVVQGLPLDWHATYQQRLDAITLDAVKAASVWQDLSIVVVGDRAKLETSLRELGLPMSVSISGSKR